MKTLAAAIVLSTAAWLPTPCLAKSITIEDFDAAIDVAADGSMDVVETIRLRFDGPWNGIHRSIPVVSTTPRGHAYRLRLSVKGIADGEGRPLRFERSRDRHYDNLKIFIPGAADTTRTISIQYTIRGGLRFFPDHDELYWNVTGDEWPFPIAAARARIRLPGDFVNVRVNAFTGHLGSTERSVAITLDGIRQAADDEFAAAGESPPPAAGGPHLVDVEATRPLGIREGLTVAVAWNPGNVRRPSEIDRAIGWFWDNLPLASLVAGLIGLPVVSFVALLDRWRKHGRDPKTGPVVVRYEPPDGLGPAEAGTLVDNSPDVRDLMAMLVDLAVKGFIRIRETAQAGWFSGPRYSFDLLVPETGWRNLPGSERKLLNGLFPYSSGEWKSAETAGQGIVCSVSTKDLEERFHTHLPGIRSAILDRLVELGHYAKRPDHVVARYGAAGVFAGPVIAGCGFAVGRWLFGLDAGTLLATCIASAATTLLVFVGFGLIMPARTKRGAEARAATRGFQEFLSRVDSHRLATLPLTPDLFERYLPYAMALGVEGRWARAFEGICKEPPTWYVGDGPIGEFHSADLTSGLSRMTAVTASAMQSSPRSSEGSGFGGGFSDGGGGFSGGGFGGGGGSGF